MARSYVEVPRTALVFMGHICSKCGFPIVTTAKIHAKATQYFLNSLDQAYEKGEEECEKAIKFEINRIKTSAKNNEPLSTNVNMISKLHYGNYCESSIRDVITACPYCLHLEKWQSKEGVSKSSKNYPIIFKDLEAAEEWAENIIINLKNEIDKNRLDDVAVKSAVEESAALKNNIRSLEQELLQIPERSELNKAKLELENLIIKQKNVAIFNLKKMHLIKCQIKNVNEKISKLNTIILKKEYEPKKLLQQNKFLLQKILPFAYGYYDKITIDASNSTKVFKITPRTTQP